MTIGFTMADYSVYILLENKEFLRKLASTTKGRFENVISFRY